MSDIIRQRCFGKRVIQLFSTHPSSFFIPVDASSRSSLFSYQSNYHLVASYAQLWATAIVELQVGTYPCVLL